MAPVMLFAQPAFEDATEAAGLTHSGETWGASWGELNGDGYPDVFVGNHREAPSLYLNNGDGTFTEVLELLDMDGLWVDKPRQDNHGASWADFDGDGDVDIMCGEFLDKFTYFENIGSRINPEYAAGRLLKIGENDAIPDTACCVVIRPPCVVSGGTAGPKGNVIRSPPDGP